MTKKLISINDEQAPGSQLPIVVRAELDEVWRQERDDLQVHKAGAETITGAKTLTAKLAARDIEVSPLTVGGNAVVKMTNGSQSWAFTVGADGKLSVLDVTAGSAPIVLAPGAAALALQVLASKLLAGADLDLGGHNLTGVGNANVANGPVFTTGAGVLPVSLLPASAMTFLGMWDASTNTPTLAVGAGIAGQTYRVSVGGNRDVGEGVTEFKPGDSVIYDGAVWRIQDNTEHVASVAGLIGAITPADLRTALSLVVGTNVQAQNANLQALAGVTSASDTLAYFTGSGAAAVTTVTAYIRGLMAAADAAAARTALGLGAAATKAGNVAVPVWYEIHAGYGVRSVGYMDNALGFMVPVGFTLGQVIYRGSTADGSGSTTCELRLNGSTLTGSSKAVAAANQWAMSGSTTAIIGANVNAGDIIRPYISAVGGTPGNGFSATLIGSITVTAT